MGIMAVNRDRLKQRPGEELQRLSETDQLERIYLPLQSMTNFTAMRERLS